MSHRIFTLPTLFTLAFFLPSFALAQITTELILPGFTNEGGNGTTLIGSGVVSSSPVIAEIDGIVENGLEIAVATKDSVLNVLRADGSLLWAQALPNANCPEGQGGEKILSSPAVGALFGDGTPYVVVGYGRIGSECKGGVAAFRGSDGFQRWNFETRRFGRRNGSHEAYASVLSTPALADIDGNGTLEIGFGSLDRHVYLLNARGRVMWYYQAADTVWSSASFAQADGKGSLEMIIGTDISKNEQINPPTQDGGYVYALRTKGMSRRYETPRRSPRSTRKKQKKFNFRDPKLVLWKTSFDQVIFSTPVIADVVPNNTGEEVIIGSGCYFPSSSDDKRGKWFKVLSLKTGEVLRTLNTSACSPSTAGVGDIDEDGVLDVVASINGSRSIGGDGNSRLMAWSGASGELLWQVQPQDSGSSDSYQAQFQSPIIVDADGNGSLEVLLATSRSIGLYAGKTGLPLHCYDSSCDEARVRLRTGSSLKASPAVADVNGDGELDVVIGSGKGGTGTLNAWSFLSEYVGSEPGTHADFASPWAMFRGSGSRSGKFAP